MNIQPYLNYFQDYVQAFMDAAPAGDLNFELKKEHSLRVMEQARELASYHGFDPQSCFLTSLAGLFHDLGRFEQYWLYRTFNDKISVNHGLLSTKILHREKVLRKLSAPDKRCVLLSVLYHNRKSLPRTLAPGNMAVAGAVRDADKLDIYPVIIHHISRHTKDSNTITLELEDANEVSPEILEQVRSGRLADYHRMRYKNDFLLLMSSWIYDLNYAYSCRRVLQKGYLDTIFAMLPQNSLMHSLRDSLLAYLQKYAKG
ncbi:HD domain-containing protein [Desulfonatronospira sp. MSAO_Bac3]|uniref:HD domain-containing protein n=1 Tax=Desulfonatronospira sp. MSAO_Bac3 TaxID=2293857 RepID=UPI000FF68E69|nr:HD domain-containing protein [Desulfonatronospira sp. MSAO_Bac3]RQD73759.1 MAG: HD domain-containing protein [Desulfonatronospira sp. MSAO_Bac3]